jgi:hypothetical protein
MRGKVKLLMMLMLAGALAMGGCQDDEQTATTEDQEDRQEMGAEGQEVERLTSQLRTGTEDARQEAAERLGEMKVRSREAIDALGSSLRDSSEDVREAAADALVDIRTSESLRTLRQGWQDMKAKGQDGWDSLQEKYDDTIDDLRDEAQDGKQFARDMLNDLGEPIQKDQQQPAAEPRRTDDEGIDLDIDT